MLCKKIIVVLVAMLLYRSSAAQHILTGTWEGQFMSTEYDLGQPRLVVEIYDFKDSSFTGISHLYYRQQKYEHYRIIGWYSRKDSLLVFREVSTIAVDLGIYGNCLGTYKMRLSKDGKNLFQHGRWVANVPGCSATTGVWLQKKIDITPTPQIERRAPVTVKPPVVVQPSPAKPKSPPVKIPKEKVNPVTTPPVTVPGINETPKRNVPSVVPPKISQRATDVQSLLEIAPEEKDSIRIDVYDNGEIDGDSVSVFVENELLINKKLITAKPLTFFVSLDKKNNPISHLRLVAESLGSIPPCTALMIVTTKSKRYEVRLSSNFSKNATVELFLKE